MGTQGFPSYDPDAETEYSTQLTNAHECLYEFKESAEFIAFTDWDDVLLGPMSGPFAPRFQDLLNKYPLAASFSITRLDAFLPTAFSKTNKFNLEKAVDTMVYGKTHPDAKVVVKPERAAGVWIHKLVFPEESKYNEVKINNKDIVILHTHNLTYSGDPRETVPRPIVGSVTELLNGKAMEQNLENFFRKHGFKFVSLLL